MKDILADSKVKKRFISGVYMNREYSWLLFDRRVLDQSQDVTNPLLERCKFLSIFGSNLDEFYMVRVGSLVNESIADPQEKDNKTGLTAAKQLEGIAAVTKGLYALRSRCYSALRKELSASGIKILRGGELTPRQKEECRAIFMSRILPLLSVMVLDAKHPLMQFENMRGYMLCELERGGRRMIGVLSYGGAIDRLYRVGGGEKVKLIPVEELVRTFASEAFMGYTVTEQMMMRVTRNADFDAHIDDSDVERDFPAFMHKKVESRAKLNVVRLETDAEQSRLKDFVIRQLKIKPSFCFTDERFFDYKFMFTVGNFLPPEKSAALKYPPLKGAVPDYIRSASSLIDVVMKRDVFLSYPYDSMSPVVDLLEQCATDDRVQSISITIYRLANHSRIADALCRASENGKQVTVVIELLARFDEENNMYFASKLREAGCTIIYGMENYKVHSKIISVVLKDGETLRYVTHLGTGNYNESTSKQYTDLNILTSDESIGEDAVAFFRNIAICNTDFTYKRLLVAPETLKPGLTAYIERETRKALSGQGGRIIAKMNSLTDRDIIDKLTEASRAGVHIDLIVRGICCLIPGIPGMTDNIRIISIVGRFLEHSRVYCFGSGEDRKMFISSADLMTRNTDKRVEIAAPVLDEGIADKIEDILRLMLSDNVKARRLCPDGKYRRVESDGAPVDAQAVQIVR